MDPEPDPGPPPQLELVPQPAPPPAPADSAPTPAPDLRAAVFGVLDRLVAGQPDDEGAIVAAAMEERPSSRVVEHVRQALLRAGWGSVDPVQLAAEARLWVAHHSRQRTPRPRGDLEPDAPPPREPQRGRRRRGRPKGAA